MLARGFNGSSNVTGGGPPFKQDTFKLTSGKKTISFKVPGGKHWFVLGTSSTGEGCQAEPRRAEGPLRDRSRDRDARLVEVVLEQHEPGGEREQERRGDDAPDR